MDNSSRRPLAWRSFLHDMFQESLRRGGDLRASGAAKLEESVITDRELRARRRALPRANETRSVKRRKRLKAGLLSGLPEGVRNHMLSFLPARDLCRYRLVCKDWNQLIDTAEFGQLHAQSNQVAPAMIVIRYLHEYVPGYKWHGWCFLDIKARKWVNADDREWMARHNFKSRGVVAMDQGLFCHFSDWEMPPRLDVGGDKSKNPRLVVVYNPTTQKTDVKALPRPPVHHTAEYYPDLALYVDNVTHSFRVFLVNHGFERSMDDTGLFDSAPLMHVYDSVSGVWKAAMNPVGINGIDVVSSVVFKGVLYIVVTFFDDYGDRSLYPLWTYDLEKDEWYNIPLEVSPEFMPCPTLVCNENHLYLVGWSMKLFLESEQNTVESSANSPWCYEVAEIFLGHHVSFISRFHLLESVMRSILEVEARNLNNLMQLPFPVESIPFDDCLMFVCSETRKVVLCDLNTGALDAQLPKLPTEDYPIKKSWVHGKHMNIMLPSTRWP